MNQPVLVTERFVLRPFQKDDIQALFLILSDRETNLFLPWYPLKSIDETKWFYHTHFELDYVYAICLKDNPIPIGYIHMTKDEPYDFGYGLNHQYWHQGIMRQATAAVVNQLKQNKVPYITATHDKNNRRSGLIMQSLGMKYMYSYEELWQPKDILVTFRLYQMNLDGNQERICMKYWNASSVHYIETIN